jgi:hypothetical protein
LVLHDFGNEMRYLRLTIAAMTGLMLAPACTPQHAWLHPAAMAKPAARDSDDAALKAWEARMVRPCKRVGQRMVC